MHILDGERCYIPWLFSLGQLFAVRTDGFRERRLRCLMDVVNGACLVTLTYVNVQACGSAPLNHSQGYKVRTRTPMV